MTNIQAPANPLSQDFNGKSLLKFAFPTMMTMMFMGLYTMVDTLFVARFVHTDALSALNIVCPVIYLIVGFSTMLATGGSAIIAREMGENQEKKASRDFTLILCAGLFSGLIIALLGITFIDKLVRGLGASARLFPYSKTYLLILLLFTPASILQVLFQNLIITAGRPGFGMMLSVGAGITNIFFDYLFMVLLHMGIGGAALGTGLGYLLPAIIGAFFFLFSSKTTLHFHKPIFTVSVLMESCTNGFSEMVSQAASAVTTFLFNRIMMKLLGENGVAAITMMIYTQFLLSALFIGFSMGVAPIISYHYGNRSPGQLKKLFKLCLSFVLTMSLLVFGFAMLAGPFLVQSFSPKGTLVYAIARKGFPLFSLSFLFSGLNIFASAAFTALSNGRVSAAISSLRTFVFLIPALLTLPHIFAETGVWSAVPAAEGLTLFFSAALLLENRKRYGY